ncbi:MAG: CpaF family protein [Candidatus Aenigmarchaeota archaeon]|nr:CpaF family protein [Candidatus Aenigmarchaeota archaeon]
MAEKSKKPVKEEKIPEKPAGGKEIKIVDARKVVDTYDFELDGVPAAVTISWEPNEYVPIYKIEVPETEPATKAVLEDIRERMIQETVIPFGEVLNPDEMKNLKERFFMKAFSMVRDDLPHLSIKKQRTLAGILMHNALGLGIIEMLLQDENLEELVINSSKEPMWAYHVKRGWLKTNVYLPSETATYNYSALIGRRVGTQITNLEPLMDAYMTSGDRANATLFPISSNGNTLTIRKFARRPWAITDFIKEGTITSEVAAFLWLAIQYELNIVVAGGTASGKTSLLNVLTSFIPPNHRVLSIEETREIQLPKFMHWVPLTTRPPNPEGKGEVSMLDLMVNSLRMRPDRIMVGEIRRSREAEVLFEAIHTGHSVYSTLHANTAEETFRRLVNPPINIPQTMLASLQLIAVMHRDRRRNVRRLLEISELISSGGMDEMRIELNTVFRWIPSKDQIMQWGKSHRVLNDIKLFTGMDDEELGKNLEQKKAVLEWMTDKGVNDINEVGRIVSEYYADPKAMLDRVEDESK